MRNYNNPRQYPRRSPHQRSDFMTVLLFYVIPFIIVNVIIFFLVTARPSCKITVGESTDYRSTTVTIKVKSLLPIKAPVAKLDGEAVELTKVGGKTYSAILKRNGSLEVDLASINRMTSTAFEAINVLDDSPPTIDEGSTTHDDVLSFRVEDSQSGVDYSSIYALDDQDHRLTPLSIDKNTGTITFDMKTNLLHVFIKDMTGNELHATFNSKGEQEDVGDPEAPVDESAASPETSSQAK